MQKKSLAIFEGKKVRRTWFNDEWWFSVVDVVEVLTESGRGRKYWSDLKTKLIEEGFEVSEKIGQLKLMAEDGKLRETDCANTKTIFRLIQSIPSPKAEPFKLWLSQVGYERIQEIENPELAQKRMRELYKAKGYSDEWIEKRVRGIIIIRDELTDEWKKRDVIEEKDFAILTNEISKATFGKTVQEYKEFKGLQKKNQNLRDHMNDWELILTMIGEKATTDITQVKNSQGFNECKTSAKEGGDVAKITRQEIEQRVGKPVISEENYLHLDEKKVKRIKNGEKD